MSVAVVEAGLKSLKSGEKVPATYVAKPAFYN
jgi:hypothetical protein